jgi:hypothetical protein
VDPLGGNMALNNLIDKAHDRNIRVVLDGVFNQPAAGSGSSITCWRMGKPSTKIGFISTRSV